MADEAFALSPISARAAQPSEADYDAIQEAFMETSRGRWFLGEYAKRNRNADTKMVLDAVARIEGTLAAQKKPERDPLFDEALASLRTALTEARTATTAALADLALEQNLAPVRKGARVIREIAWRLREIGADGRICDLIDSQVGAIEAAAAKMSPADLAGALGGAFDRIEEKIASFDADGVAAAAPAAPTKATPQASDAAPAAKAEEHAAKPAETGETKQASPAAHAAEAAAAHPAVSDEAQMAAAAESAGGPRDAFDAGDEAMLDMVAMEMAAPDTDAAYDPTFDEDDIDENRAHEPQVETIHESVASYEIDVTFPDSGDAVGEPITASALPIVTPLQPAPEPEPEPALPISLGSSLLANGIVTRPRTSRPDPLAPIRRMSQTEKIAFFS
jgi:hypothetical protein